MFTGAGVFIGINTEDKRICQWNAFPQQGRDQKALRIRKLEDPHRWEFDSKVWNKGRKRKTQSNFP